MSNADSPKVELMLKLARAFETKDTGLLAKHVHKDYHRIIYPRSLGIPEQTGEEWLRNSAESMSLWAGDSKLTFHSITEAGEKVIVHFGVEAKTSIGVDLRREDIQIITVVTDDDGILKMKDVEVFVDSKAHLDFVKAVAEAKANRQQHAA